MPLIRKELAQTENAIFESNSLVQWLRPDLYLVVLDHATADFKPSALRFLDRADALLLRASSSRLRPHWNGVSAKLIAGKPEFLIAPPDWVGQDLIEFVKHRL